MTTKERLISLLGFKPADDNAVTGALTDAGFTGMETYLVTNARAIKIIAVTIMELLLTTADYSSTDGVTVKYDRNAIQARIKLLKGELGLTDQSFPTISTKRVW